MKTAEIIESIKDNESWYGSRLCGLRDILGDIEDAKFEGYIEGVHAYIPNGFGLLVVCCGDGIVYVTQDGSRINCKADMYRTNEAVENDTATYSRPRTASPYERTRAMVYATGNKWAIENFNATH